MMFSMRIAAYVSTLCIVAIMTFPDAIHSRSLGHEQGKDKNKLAEYLLKKAWLDEIVNELVEESEEDDDKVEENGLDYPASDTFRPYGVQGIKYGDLHLPQHQLPEQKQSTKLGKHSASRMLEENSRPADVKSWHLSRERAAANGKTDADWIPNIDYSSINLFKRLLLSQAMDGQGPMAAESNPNKRLMNEKMVRLPFKQEALKYETEGIKDYANQENAPKSAEKIIEAVSEKIKNSRWHKDGQSPKVLSVKELALEKPIRNGDRDPYSFRMKHYYENVAGNTLASDNVADKQFANDVNLNNADLLHQHNEMTNRIYNSDKSLTPSRVHISSEEGLPIDEQSEAAEILKLLNAISSEKLRDVTQKEQNALPLDEPKGVGQRVKVGSKRDKNEGFAGGDEQSRELLDILKRGEDKEKSPPMQSIDEASVSGQNHLDLRGIADILSSYFTDAEKAQEKSEHPKGKSSMQRSSAIHSEDSDSRNAEASKFKDDSANSEQEMTEENRGSSQKAAVNTKISSDTPEDSATSSDIIDQIEARVAELERKTKADKAQENEMRRKKLRM